MEIDINKSSLGPVILDINGLILSKNKEYGKKFDKFFTTNREK